MVFILFSDDTLKRPPAMNFAKWKADIMMILTIMDRDHSFRENKLVEPVAEGDNDTTLAL
jgi:hypothetical protein